MKNTIILLTHFILINVVAQDNMPLRQLPFKIDESKKMPDCV